MKVALNVEANGGYFMTLVKYGQVSDSVENKVSEALLQTCPNCKISCSKSDECNKITVSLVSLTCSVPSANTAGALYVEQI